jgi:hypothetical protein
VIDKIMALAPPDSTLLGIDDQAALIVAGHSWEAGGLGSVTILRRGAPAHVIEAGMAIPENVLSLHTVG